MIPSCAWSRIVSKYRTDNGSNAGLVFFSFVFFQKGSKIDSKRSAARSAALYRAVELWERWSKAKAIKQATTSAGRRRPGADASGFVWRRRRSRVGGGWKKSEKSNTDRRRKETHEKPAIGNRGFAFRCLGLYRAVFFNDSELENDRKQLKSIRMSILWKVYRVVPTLIWWTN